MTAQPWTTADLRNMVEHPGTGWDARLAATLLALQEHVDGTRHAARIDVILLQEQVGYALRTIAALEAGVKAHSAEHRARQWLDPSPQCHDCDDHETLECPRCSDTYCRAHRDGHEKECWR